MRVQIAADAARIAADEAARSDSDSSLGSLFSLIDESFAVADSFSARSQLSATDAEYYPLEQSVSRVRQQIKGLQAQKTELTKTNAQLCDKVQACDRYLKNLQNNPEQLFTDLKSAITAHCFDAFEINNIDLLTPKERVVLRELKNIFNVIAEGRTNLENYNLEQKEVESQEGMPQQESLSIQQQTLRLHYAQLVGFVWAAFHKIHAEQPDSKLCQSLRQILEEEHVPNNASLACAPFDGTQWTCENLYNGLRHNFMTEQALIDKENEAYTAALKKLGQLAEPSAVPGGENTNDNVDSGNLGRDDESLRSLKQRMLSLGEKNPDKKYLYTRIMNDTSDLVTLPFNDAQFRKYIKLCNKVAGAPSCGKKVAGIMCMIAGVVLLGVALGIATGGIALPAAMLLKFTSAAVVSQQTVNAIATIVGLTGIATFALGVWLFARTGLSRQMEEIADGVKLEENDTARAGARNHALR